MIARVNKLPGQQDESLYLSHFRKLRFGIQIPLDLKNEFFGLWVDLVTMATEKFHLASHRLTLNVQTVFVYRSFMIFPNLVAR